jgi:4-diphosphocytidyl-2-C-methyl-D-erythritol kinase
MPVIEAPAKINLTLRVLRRRDDGFHEIATRMAPLQLADRLTLEALPGAAAGTVQFSCDDPAVPGDETNLAVKAVRALEQLTGRLPGVRMHLEKRIPHGAGMGGGSSDAAAVLRGLAALFSPALPAEGLAQAAAAVGSDVPFFLHGCVCDCTGRGEIVTPASDFAWCPRVLLLKPPFGVPASTAYRRWQASREVPGFAYAPQPSPGGELFNDLERPVFEKYPVLGTLKLRLLDCEGVAAALLSGSGATVFAILEADAEAAGIVAAAQEEIGEELWWCETALRSAR